MGFLVASAVLVCVTSQRVPGYCKKKPAVGPCKALIEKWYFDYSTQSCKTFYYGGCGGNGNKFSSRKKCREACLPKRPSVPVCKQMPDPGFCRAYMPHWFFNSKSGYCEGFVYGGCQGNDNRFKSCWQCMKKCRTAREANRLCWKLTKEFNKKFLRNVPTAKPLPPK
uniref:Amblin n=1 Tax=Amblyomma hebraeum TaxID=34608 RepID=KUNI_AMBHE|nr:RecName: Full=Amblin; AltName: Full=Thrombin inhibitor; Flags: Precursor [Amblyomma hebraeum]AAR97367.1 thrombin inhibitor [Amblyomma hebraeum]